MAIADVINLFVQSKLTLARALAYTGTLPSATHLAPELVKSSLKIPMASDTPAADNGYPVEKHSRSRLPVIPDLRFEYSYLRSIRPYFHIKRSTSESAGAHPADPALEDQEYETINIPGDGKDTERNDKISLSPTPILASEIIHVQWGRVIWITVRDQVISPLLQGALW